MCAFIVNISSSFQGKKLPYSLGADAEEGEVSDEDSADEIEDDCKLKPCYVCAYTQFPEHLDLYISYMDTP